MDEQSFIDAAERRRKRRERELLLLLLLITDHAIRDAINSYRHGNDWKTVLRNRIMGRPEAGIRDRMVPAIQRWSTYAHLSAEQLTTRYLGQKLPSTTPPDYSDSSKEIAQRTLDALIKSFGTGIELAAFGTVAQIIKSIREQLKVDGYTKSDSHGLASGVEIAIVTAFNVGIASAAVALSKPGFEHHSVMDEATTKYCRPRNGTRLPMDHPYWLTSFPSLHFRCRSILLPSKSNHWTGVPDAPPAMPGFGIMPESLRILIHGR